MTSKTIKISEENYRWLLEIAAEMQKEYGKPISFDDTLDNIKNKKERKSIMALAGSWKMSDDEWNNVRKSLEKTWKKWKIKSA